MSGNPTGNAIIGSATDTMTVFLLIFFAIFALLAFDALFAGIRTWRWNRRQRAEEQDEAPAPRAIRLPLASQLRRRHWRLFKASPLTFRQGLGDVRLMQKDAPPGTDDSSPPWLSSGQVPSSEPLPAVSAPPAPLPLAHEAAYQGGDGEAGVGADGVAEQADQGAGGGEVGPAAGGGEGEGGRRAADRRL